MEPQKKTEGILFILLIVSLLLFGYTAYQVGSIANANNSAAASLAQFERVVTQVVNNQGMTINQIVCVISPTSPGCPKK